jgi:hypothetical protein
MPYIVRQTGRYHLPADPPVAVQTVDHAALADLSHRIARTQERLWRSLAALTGAETMLDHATAVLVRTWRPTSATTRSG